MLSQTAERVYWFARYIERTENIARLILVRHQLILDLPTKVQPDWQVLIDMLGVHESFDQSGLAATEKNIVRFLFGDRNNSSSILSSVVFARENMRTTREILPSETWECVNSLYLKIKRIGKDLARRQRYEVLNEIILACQQITGLLAGTMNHDDAYQFVILGRNIERADMSTRIVDVGTASLSGPQDEKQPYQNVLWISILRSLSAYQMYRLNVRRKVSPEAVLAFLLKSTVFPRAAAHNLAQLETSVKNLARHDQPLALIQQLRATIEAAPLADLQGLRLHEFIDEFQAELAIIHSSINATWLHPEIAAEGIVD